MSLDCVPASVKTVEGLHGSVEPAPEWGPNHPNWIDPVDYPKWCLLQMDNGVSGCELWIRLEDVNGEPQWHQVS